MTETMESLEMKINMVCAVYKMLYGVNYWLLTAWNHQNSRDMQNRDTQWFSILLQFMVLLQWKQSNKLQCLILRTFFLLVINKYGSMLDDYLSSNGSEWNLGFRLNKTRHWLEVMNIYDIVCKTDITFASATAIHSSHMWSSWYISITSSTAFCRVTAILLAAIEI